MSIAITSESGFSEPTIKNVVRFSRLRRAMVAVIGFTVLLIGIVMVVLPGPAVLVIPLGLAILATEFVWAKRLLDRARSTIARNGARKREQIARRMSSGVGDSIRRNESSN